MSQIKKLLDLTSTCSGIGEDLGLADHFFFYLRVRPEQTFSLSLSRAIDDLVMNTTSTCTRNTINTVAPPVLILTYLAQYTFNMNVPVGAV